MNNKNENISNPKGDKKNEISLIPFPKSIQKKEESIKLTFSDVSTIYCSEESRQIAEYFINWLHKGTGVKMSVSLSNKEKQSSTIVIELDNEKEFKNEGYELETSEQSVNILSNSKAGLFYGVQTLRQLISPSAESDPLSKEANQNKNSITFEIPQVSIEDYPEFSWRGFMLDDCRHFHGKKTVKKMLEIMALLKMNVFHWHLTEDQGWRIEIKKYPKLVEIGSKRKDTQLKNTRSKIFRGKPHEGFYSQDDAREIIEFAKKRFITVVPEIEIPGHSQAAIAAYPELGCTGKQFDVAKKFGIMDVVYCPGKDKTFQFWYDVLDEVMEIFPSKIIHTGGDEVPKTYWKKCPDCQKRIQEKGLKNEEELQVYVTNTVASYLASKGRRLMGWNEILDNDLEDNAIGHYWAHSEDEVLEHIDKGRDFVVSKNRYTYLNYNYRSLSLKKAYEFDPYLNELKDDNKDHILGIEAPAWTEWIPDRKTLEWQVFPRLLSITEIGWLGKEKPNYTHFKKRTKNFEQRLEALGVNYATELERDTSFLGSLKKVFRKWKNKN